ncbi:Acyl-CoA N-acyltransferase [Pseudocohnilembus persalinus]|uniref:Acyl-CoA N-acyltransferase n=1 Tax=Pseudocohnilembus persalinus TaxID=266149 RepID=A0A0V0QXH6_PSEPJ|nr:Acyl-CoA N-acyltransferase [Pseudocohnilembus persalinus]|eukprot:KRX06910.1 Acyl-CoA N-acyltransferase [Pseudocohnilembus persalinus]
MENYKEHQKILNYLRKYQTNFANNQIILTFNYFILTERKDICYRFSINLLKTQEKVGHISINIGNSNDLVFYYGHIGYNIYSKFRNQGFATQAVQILINQTIFSDLESVGQPVYLINANPENIASRKVAEKCGFQFLDIIDIPKNHQLYIQGDKQGARYEYLNINFDEKMVYPNLNVKNDSFYQKQQALEKIYRNQTKYDQNYYQKCPQCCSQTTLLNINSQGQERNLTINRNITQQFRCQFCNINCTKSQQQYVYYCKYEKIYFCLQCYNPQYYNRNITNNRENLNYNEYPKQINQEQLYELKNKQLDIKTKCLFNHNLQIYEKDDVKIKTLICDICENNKLYKEKMVYGCRQCDIDFCESCFKLQQKIDIKCNKQHDLYTYDKNFQKLKHIICDYCDCKDSFENKHVKYCRDCDLDICQQCFIQQINKVVNLIKIQQEKQLKCPNNHYLNEINKYDNNIVKLVCDLCDQQSMYMKQNYYSCRICDYDLCEKCNQIIKDSYNLKELPIHNNKFQFRLKNNQIINQKIYEAQDQLLQ